MNRYLFSLGLLALFGLNACGEEKTPPPPTAKNPLLQKQDEIEGKAIRATNNLLHTQQQHLQDADK